MRRKRALHDLPRRVHRGEPDQNDEGRNRRASRAGALTGVRLSCQILCDHDMTVRAISRLAGSGRPDPGPTPEPTIQPPPES